MKPSFRLGFATRVAGETHNPSSTFKPGQSSPRAMRLFDGLRRLTLPQHARSIGRYLALLLLIGVAITNAQGAIGFVQVNSAVPQSSQASIQVTFANAQTAGN